MRIIAAIAVVGLIAAIAQSASAGMLEASVDDRMQALRSGGLTAASLQRHSSYRGFYKDAIGGDFGLASRKALRDWAAAGHPET